MSQNIDAKESDHHYDEEEKHHPARTTMEGMIWNANHVLMNAVKGPDRTIPVALLEQCVGIVLISMVQGGLVLSGSAGTGILLKKKSTTGGEYFWSLPCAIGMSGIGYGLLAGLSVKDFIILIMSEDVLEAIASSSKGFKIGGRSEMTLGNFGQTLQMDLPWNAVGSVRDTVTISYTKGLLAGVSIEGSVISKRDVCNRRFYDGDYTPIQIMNNDDGSVTIPDGKITLLKEVYHKLNLLASGHAFEDHEAEKEKILRAKAQADSVHDNIIAMGDKDSDHPIISFQSEEYIASLQHHEGEK